MQGKVWLVGAGPGDRGLLTLKGLEVLKNAQVVVYDALVGDEVLTLIPDQAKKINAGKRSGRHLMAQEGINQVLLDEALAGNRVVRLKGGDPFVFGRGGEELELLAEKGVPFEVVPGVTSAFAVPAYNGIPVTHREFASSVHVITGHRRAKAQSSQRDGSAEEIKTQAPEGPGIDFEALVRLEGTLLFLMGISSLPTIMEGLLAAGMDPDRPAAVLEKGTTAGQRRIAGTVSTLAREAAAFHAQSPAIIIVGDVCRLADSFAWFDRFSDRPLAGRKILVTRPKELISGTSELLRGLGAEVLELPAIETVPIRPNPALERALAGWRDWCDPNIVSIPSAAPADSAAVSTPSAAPADSAAVSAASAAPADSAAVSAASAAPADSAASVKPDWLVFTSPTGVRVFMDAFLKVYDIRALWGTKIAVIGEGSARELRRFGLREDFLPSVYDGETLGRELAQRIRKDRAGHALPAGNGKKPAENSTAEKSARMSPVSPDRETVRILIPRAAIGNRELIEELKKAGDVELLDIPTYETVYTAPGIVDARAQVRDGQIDFAVFTSASTVRGFCASMGDTDLSGVRAVCIGRQTAAAARAAGMQTEVARKATLEALVDAVVAASNTAAREI